MVVEASQTTTYSMDWLFRLFSIIKNHTCSSLICTLRGQHIRSQRSHVKKQKSMRFFQNVGWSVLLFFAAYGQLTPVCGAAPAVPERPGQAALVFSLDQKSHFSFSAKLAMPCVPTNKGQYSIWIYVGEYKDSLERPAGVKTGLMWWKPDKFVLQQFVEVESSGANSQYSLSPPLTGDPSKEHEFRIVREGNNLNVYMDSELVFATLWSSYFRDDMHIYLRIASEAFVGGDEVSGTVRDIGLTTPKERLEPYLPTTADEDRGVVFLCKGHAFVATGTFDSKKPFAPRWFRPPLCKEEIADERDLTRRP
jgi:hypothetical protein